MCPPGSVPWKGVCGSAAGLRTPIHQSGRSHAATARLPATDEQDGEHQGSLDDTGQRRVDVEPQRELLGAALADEIMSGIDDARVSGARYILGCPGGRSPLSTYRALAERAAGADLGPQRRQCHRRVVATAHRRQLHLRPAPQASRQLSPP